MQKSSRPALDQILIVIAAGGDGARMGGGKPARLLGGVRLVDHMVRWALEHGTGVRLAVRPGQGDWGTGLPAIEDRHADIGPISALASAMHSAAADGFRHVALIGCDMPFLPNDLLARLLAALADHGAAMPESAGHLHPLAALWRVDPSAVEDYITAGGQSVKRFADTVGLARVAWEGEPDPFANVNDAAVLAAAEARLTAQAR